MLKNFQGYFEIKPGKFVYVQHPDFRVVASRRLMVAKRKWRAPHNYFHFRKGGHVAALREHESNIYFGRLDIQNFFSSVTKNKSIRSLKKIGFSFIEAQEFASESVVNIGGKLVLPYGFIQSPFLASLSLAHSDLGNCLRRLQNTDIKITVYMDDILISSNSSELVSSAMKAIEHAADNSLMRINPSKRLGPALMVEAFNVDLSNNALRIADLKFAEFCQRMIDLGDCIASQATIGYVRTINEPQADHLATVLGGKEAL